MLPNPFSAFFCSFMSCLMRKYLLYVPHLSESQGEVMFISRRMLEYMLDSSVIRYLFAYLFVSCRREDVRRCESYNLFQSGYAREKGTLDGSIIYSFVCPVLIGRRPLLDTLVLLIEQTR